MKKKSTKMNKGFSLLEIIIYIALFSILMIGIFSSLFDSLQRSEAGPPFLQEDYDSLIKNYHEQ